MVDQIVITEMQALVPAGQRSDFVNAALHSALLQFGRNLAVQKIDEFKMTHKLTITTEEIIQAKNHGRE